MSLPAAIESCRTLQNVQYELTTGRSMGSLHTVVQTSDLKAEQVVRMILLSDSIGKLQLLIPANCLIDLSRLCEMLGRNLQAVSSEETKALAQRYGTATLPALPALTGLPTLADSRLFKNSELYLETGVPNLYIKMSQDQFRQAISEVELEDFAEPCTVSEVLEQRERDENTIVQAVEKFTTLRIKQRLDQTLEIPPMPDTAERIIRLRVDPNAGVSELAAIVEMDPSLAAQVVSWAASPYYAAPGKIKGVQDAIMRVLGFDLVINLALGLSLGKTLNLPKDGPRGVTPYWQQAVFCASCMEKLAKIMPSNNRPAVGLSYLAGLLHNFGYLVLAHVFPPYFSVMARYIEANPHISHDLIESHVIGVTREQIASWLMTAWNMPEEVATAIRWQQNPDYCERMSVYPNLLYVALNLLRKHGIGSGPAEEIPAEMLQRMGLDRAKAEKAVEDIVANEAAIKSIAATMGR